MDVAFFTASLSLSLYTPRYLFHSKSCVEQSSVAVALGLSLNLFSLSILEAIPSRWLFILSHEVPQEDTFAAAYTFTISEAYWLLLWALCVFLIVALPCLAGVSMALGFGELLQNTSQVDRDDRKYPLFNWRKLPWWLRFLLAILKIILSQLATLIRKVCCPRRPIEPVLAMTVSDDDMRQSSHHETERRVLMAVAQEQHHYFLMRYRNAILFGCICGVTSMLVVTSFIGPMVVQTNIENGFLSIAVSWLCAIGLIVSALLNGFGSVSMPYSCLAGLYLEPIRPEAITKAEAELQSVLAALESKRSDLREMAVTIASRPGRFRKSSQPPAGRILPSRSNSFGKSITPTFADLGDDVTQRRQVIQTEIFFLVNLARDMRADIDEMRYAQKMAANARTRMGKIQSWLGVVFSVILVIRLLSAAVSIWYSRMPNALEKRPRGDTITTVLLFLTGHNLVSHEDFTMLSQSVSLILTAVLAFTQIRTFLRTVTVVNRRLNGLYQKWNCPRHCCSGNGDDSMVVMDDRSPFGNSGGLYSHLIASLMGCYFLSCIVVTKMMLPEKYCLGFSSAMGGMDVFSIHFSVVNSAYAFSAAISASVLGMLFGIQRQNTLRNKSSFTEKLSFNGSEAV